MKKILSIILMVFMFCATVAINANAIKVDIPFDYYESSTRIYDKANSNDVSV